MSRPGLVAVIGANGAGKTTWSTGHRQRLPLHFYNADAIAEGLGDANDPGHQAEARTIVDAAIETRFRSREPFGFESTWSGSSRPAIVRRAHAEGYETHAVFLGTRHPDINVQRVRRRVLEGGHDIAENEIRRRWHAAGENLVRNWQFFEHIVIVDNSGRATRVLFAKDHDAAVVLRELPPWAKRLTGHALGWGNA